MPTYVYKVKNSNQTFEYKQSINDKPLEFLPKDIEGYDETNPKEVERILTPNVNFLFHGSGFYETDYKKSEKKVDSSCSTNSCACSTN